MNRTVDKRFLFYTICFILIVELTDAKNETSGIKFVYGFADLTVQLPTFRLEAFKSMQNELLFDKEDVSLYSNLTWASFGAPRLVPIRSPFSRTTYTFHFDRDRFYTHVELLSVEERDLLRKKCFDKYKINVSADQFVQIPNIHRLECKLKQPAASGSQLNVNGRVTDLKQLPLRLYFDSELTPQIRKEIKKSSSLVVNCDIEFGNDFEWNGDDDDHVNSFMPVHRKFTILVDKNEGTFSESDEMFNELQSVKFQINNLNESKLFLMFKY